jgi:hypothetical protein
VAHPPSFLLPVGESMMLRTRLLALITGAALFFGVYLILRFSTRLSPFIILGSEFSIMFLWRFVRAFIGPIATNRNLRMAQVLLALPVGIYSVATFLAAWSPTSHYAPWVFLVGVLLFFGISRPYIRKLPRQAH